MLGEPAESPDRVGKQLEVGQEPRVSSKQGPLSGKKSVSVRPARLYTSIEMIMIHKENRLLCSADFEDVIIYVLCSTLP